MWPKACNRDKKGSRQKLVSFPVKQQRVGYLSLNLLPTLHNLIWQHYSQSARHTNFWNFLQTFTYCYSLRKLALRNDHVFTKKVTDEQGKKILEGGGCVLLLEEVVGNVNLPPPRQLEQNISN